MFELKKVFKESLERISEKNQKYQDIFGIKKECIRLI